MKITAVEVIPFAIPYVKPLKFASGEVRTADHVLVRVHTDDGIVGVAEAPPRPFTYGETQASIVAVVEQIFAPRSSGSRSPSARWPAGGWRAPWAIRQRSPRSTWRSGMRWAAPSNCP